MTEILNSGVFWGVAVAFFLSFTGCWLIISHPKLSARAVGSQADVQATQAMHCSPTPRIGGISIILAFATALLLFWQVIGPDLMAALAAGTVVFLVGVREDLNRDVSSRNRLIAAFLSACLATAFSQASVSGLGLPEVDWLFSMTIIAVGVTLLWSAGVCHAINLIDGLNGLSSGYVIVATLSFFIIAQLTGQSDIAFTCAFLAAAIAGFFVWNWPQGRVFLGDAGAYALGHILAWLGILLIWRVESLSGFAVLLILFWPVADTIFTIFRRKIRRMPAGRPDRLHFHHLTAQALGLILGPKTSLGTINAASTAILLPFSLAPAAFGVWFWDQPAHASVMLLVFTILFIASYIFGQDYLSRRRFERRGNGATYFQLVDAPADTISPLSGIFIEDSLAVDVRIVKVANTGLWSLQTIADGADGRIWPKHFGSDHEAWASFMETVREDGMEAVVGW